MKEITSNGMGWRDRGNNKRDKPPSAGPVATLYAHEDPYTDSEVSEIIRQGRDNPRRLTMKQSKLAAANRAKANADLRAMEAWAAAEL